MTPLRYLAAVALVIAATCPAFAADPVFPPGARVGMTPLVGLGKAKSFIGFETEDQGVKVLVEREALSYIDGTEVDFVKQGLNEAFKFRNPNIKGECGCGESFTV